MIEVQKITITYDMEIDEYFEEQLKQNIEDVYCCHCGKRFKAFDIKIIKNEHTGNKILMCKHYPECDGELRDLFFGEDCKE